MEKDELLSIDAAREAIADSNLLNFTPVFLSCDSQNGKFSGTTAIYITKEGNITAGNDRKSLDDWLADWAAQPNPMATTHEYWAEKRHEDAASLIEIWTSEKIPEALGPKGAKPAIRGPQKLYSGTQFSFSQCSASEFHAIAFGGQSSSFADYSFRSSLKNTIGCYLEEHHLETRVVPSGNLHKDKLIHVAIHDETILSFAFMEDLSERVTSHTGVAEFMVLLEVMSPDSKIFGQEILVINHAIHLSPFFKPELINPFRKYLAVSREFTSSLSEEELLAMEKWKFSD